VSLVGMLPLNGLFMVILHSLLTILTVNLLRDAVIGNDAVIASLIVTFAAFVILLLSTSRLFKIDYGYVLVTLKRGFVK